MNFLLNSQPTFLFWNHKFKLQEIEKKQVWMAKHNILSNHVSIQNMQSMEILQYQANSSLSKISKGWQLVFKRGDIVSDEIHTISWREEGMLVGIHRGEECLKIVEGDGLNDSIFCGENNKIGNIERTKWRDKWKITCDGSLPIDFVVASIILFKSTSEQISS